MTAANELVDMVIRDVRVEKHGSLSAAYTVILAAEDGSCCLPIGVAPADGTAIAIHLHQMDTMRPLAYVLMNNIIGSLGGSVTEVRVEKVVGESYHALVVIEGVDGKTQQIDARPSDALALALVSGTCVRVHRDLTEPDVLQLEGSMGADEIVAEVSELVPRRMKTYWPWPRPVP